MDDVLKAALRQRLSAYLRAVRRAWLTARSNTSPDEVSRSRFGVWVGIARESGCLATVLIAKDP